MKSQAKLTILPVLEKAKKIIEETKKELEQEHIKFNNDIKVGIMVEVPSVAVNAEMYAKESKSKTEQYFGRLEHINIHFHTNNKQLYHHN